MQCVNLFRWSFVKHWHFIGSFARSDQVRFAMPLLESYFAISTGDMDFAIPFIHIEHLKARRYAPPWP